MFAPKWGFTVFCIVLLLTAHLRAEEASPAGKTFEITCDPRIELISILQLLSTKHGGEGSGLVRGDSEYKAEVSEYFAPWVNHVAVTMLAEMSTSEPAFVYGAPASVMLRLSAPPELTVVAPMRDDLKTVRMVTHAGGREHLDRFLNVVRDFARQSNFRAFYEEHSELYAQAVAAARSAAPDEIISWMEEYYGVSHKSYSIIMVPLYGEGGFGPLVEGEDGTCDLYCISAFGANMRELLCERPGTFPLLLIHEFSHSFVNPVFFDHVDEFASSARLFDPDAKHPTGEKIEEWMEGPIEYLVRAATIRLLALHVGQEAAGSVIELEKRRGFEHIERVCRCIEEYEGDRQKYPSFDKFAPRLAALFDGLYEQQPVE